MKTSIPTLLLAITLPACPARAQTVLYDFENAQAGSGLPLDLTVGGITAHFTSSGLGGFYIQQPQNTILYTPIGFSGNGLIPSSIYAADLHVGFSRSLSAFSILYAPQELACDSSARMRVTAYRDGTSVGTATTNAAAGTWPSETLSITSTQAFNSVVVHYDAPPPTGGDYGPIFVADNMQVTLAPEPPTLLISRSVDQIQLLWTTNAIGFSLQTNSNLSASTNWGVVTNVPVVVGDQNVVWLPLAGTNTYFRLKQQ